MTIPNMQDVNEDARVLRVAIDNIVERLVDFMEGDEAEREVAPLYDAVTRLHELAASAVRANEVAGIRAGR